ncbi:MAG: hypothetical protein ACRDV4_03905 [Acidimicrobiales bacterium]
MSLSVPVCGSCGEAVFPAMLLCPRCAASEWRVEQVDRGILEGCTVLERDGIRVGLVRVPLGPLVVARVAGDLKVADEVALTEDAHVPLARPF